MSPSVKLFAEHVSERYLKSAKKVDIKEEFLAARENAKKVYLKKRQKRMSDTALGQLSLSCSCIDDCYNDKDEDIGGICQVYTVRRGNYERWG